MASLHKKVSGRPISLTESSYCCYRHCGVEQLLSTCHVCVCVCVCVGWLFPAKYVMFRIYRRLLSATISITICRRFFDAWQFIGRKYTLANESKSRFFRPQINLPLTLMVNSHLNFLLTCSFTHHFFLFWFTTPLIFNSPSLSITAENLPVSQILPPEFHCFFPDCLHRLLLGPFLLSYSVFVFSFSYFLFLCHALN